MNMKKKDIRNMIKCRNRAMRMAKMKYNDAKFDYEMGNINFVKELQLASKYVGAVEVMDYMLQKMGYDKESIKQRELLKMGIIQRGIGLSAWATGFLIFGMFGGMAGVIGCVVCVPVGANLIFTRKQKIFLDQKKTKRTIEAKSC